MKEFIHSLKFKIIVGIFALVVGFMVYAAVSAGAASWPEKILKTVTAPFSRLSVNISNFVNKSVDEVVNADKYKKENEKLRSSISELNKRNVNVDELEKENRLLREMLEMSEQNPDFKWPDKVSTVVSWNANDIFRGFTVNCGSNDKVALYNLVMTKVGVVGVITDVASNYAVVTSILSADINIRVSTTHSGAKGVLQNDADTAQKGLVRMSYIEIDADIKEGDIIVTLGSMYPPNQIIGEVTQVYEDTAGLYKHALIKPSEDMKNLTGVLVITDFEGKEEISLPDKEDNKEDN